MQSGQVKLQALVDARKEFTTDEWLAVLLRTMGYEPAAYGEQQRHRDQEKEENVDMKGDDLVGNRGQAGLDIA